MERTFHMMIYRLFHAQRGYLRPHLDEIGLGSGQPKLLTYLCLNGSCNQRELADYFEIDPAAVSRMLESMKKGGFIERAPDERNRRSEIITPTEKGRSASEKWRCACTHMERQLLRGFTPEETVRFADLLSRAYRNLKTAQEEETVCGI